MYLYSLVTISLHKNVQKNSSYFKYFKWLTKWLPNCLLMCTCTNFGSYNRCCYDRYSYIWVQSKFSTFVIINGSDYNNKLVHCRISNTINMIRTFNTFYFLEKLLLLLVPFPKSVQPPEIFRNSLSLFL